MTKILVTGASGFVGSYLCKELLKNEENILYLIVRKKGNQSSSQRMEKVLCNIMNKEEYEKCKERINVIKGDIQEEKLGITREEYKYLTKNIRMIFHCAASIRFSLSYEEAKRINIDGTERVLALFKKINRKDSKFNYVSTSYVGGDCVQNFSENDLNVNQKFNNTYEQTKYECEQIMQNYINQGYRITIFRPSIVSGSSENGGTQNSNIILKFFKMLYRGKIKEFYCDSKSSINIVPINYFVGGMVYLADKPEGCYKTFHFVNESNINVEKLVIWVCEILNVEIPKFINFDSAKKINSSPLRYFFEYVKLSHTFNSDYTSKMLCEEDIICPQISKSYISKNIEYCIKNNLI